MTLTRSKTSLDRFEIAEEQILLVFRLGSELRYAIPLAYVERVTSVAAITPLPGAPTAVRGVLDVEGTVRPVFDLRKRFGLPTRSLLLSDKLILAHSERFSLALLVDAVEGLRAYDEGDWTPCADLPEGTGPFVGILKDAEGLVLIHELEKFLTEEESDELDVAMESGGQEEE